MRVPYADVGALVIEDDALPDEQVLFLSDVLPTAYMAAENCGIRDSDVVAIWGAGPVGHLAAACARLLGARDVIIIDRFDYRLDAARHATGAHTINYVTQDENRALMDLTGGRGPDCCIDAVGMEAHSSVAPLEALDRAKQATRMVTDRGAALRRAIMSCRNGGTVSIAGTYAGFMDHFPVGSLMNRSLTVRTGQAHVHRYMAPLLERIVAGDLDPRSIISHRLDLDQAPAGYEMFKNKKDDCLKVVLAA